VSGLLVAPAAAADCVPVDGYRRGTLRPDHAGQPVVAGANFGSAMVAGDFDRDGFADLVVGAPNDVVDGSAAGAVYVFPGSATGPVTGTGAARRLTQADIGAGDEAGDRFGASLAAGDFNNDGYADLAVGIPGEAVGSLAGAGAVAYFLGGGSGLRTGVWRDQEPTGGAAEAGDTFGHALAAGDFDNDGYTDLAVGVPGEAPSSDPKSGMVAVFRGGSSGLVNGYGFTQEGLGAGTNETDDRFGYSLAAGDTNADGYPDLAIGAPGESPGSAAKGGSVYLARGSATGLDTGFGVPQEDIGGSSEAGDEYGYAVAVGNFDGDAYPDIAVGVPGEAPAGGSAEQPTSGDIAVIQGGTGTEPGGYWVHPYDAGEVAEDGDRFGSALTAGDVDADGRADLLVGSPAKRTDGQAANAGVTYLFGGTTRGLELGRRVAQPDIGWAHESGDRFGSATALVDVTGDGRAEAVIGARGEASPGLPASGLVAWIGGLVSGLGLGGLVGATTGSTAKIWVRGNDAGQFQVQYRPAATTGWTTAPAVPFGSLSGADLAAVSTLTGLAADSRYEYRIAVDCRVVPFSTGRFRTLAPASAGSVRFGYGADMLQPSAQSARGSGQRTQKPFRILDHVVAGDPAFIVYGGDNIYSDVPSESATTTADYLAKYRENWGEVNLRAALASVSSYMTWDDHEIDNDWPNQSLDEGKDPAAQYARARPAYDIYQHSHNPAPPVAGELYYSFRSGPVDMVVLDTRTHRTRQLQPADDPTRTMLGATQLEQLKAWLSASTAPYKVIVSSVPFAQRACGSTPPEGHDSWCGYTHERGNILDYITANDITNVVVVSGDRHWSGAFELNTGPGSVPVTEIIATPLGIDPGAAPCPLPSSCSQITDERTLWTDTGHRYAFGLFDVTPAGMTVTLRDEANAVMYQTVI
jgi:hypothetical protein